MDATINVTPRRSFKLPAPVISAMLPIAGLIAVVGYMFNYSSQIERSSFQRSALEDSKRIEFDKKTEEKFLSAFRAAGSNNLNDPAVVQALGAKGGIRFTFLPAPISAGYMMNSFSQMKDALQDGEGKPEDARVYVLTKQGANGGWIGSWDGLQQAQKRFSTEIAAKQLPGPLN